MGLRMRKSIVLIDLRAARVRGRFFRIYLFDLYSSLIITDPPKYVLGKTSQLRSNYKQLTNYNALSTEHNVCCLPDPHLGIQSLPHNFPKLETEDKSTVVPTKNKAPTLLGFVWMVGKPGVTDETFRGHLLLPSSTSLKASYQVGAPLPASSRHPSPL